MALSIAIVGKVSTSLYVSVHEREKAREFALEMFMYSSLDIVDEKAFGASRTQELYLGPLLTDPNFKSYGYVTNTNIKMIVVTDVGNTSLKDQDLRQIFKQLHNAYCLAISNPFYIPGNPIKSRMNEQSSGFSGVVKIANVSDFIVPSKACIIPLQPNENTPAQVRIRQKNEDKTKKMNSKVTITLSDCLVCSGCITTAETVLLKEQSRSMFMEGLRRTQLAVLTVSPQAIVSIACHKKIRANEAAKYIAQGFRALGVSYVLDSSFARLLTLELSNDEFVQRRSAQSQPIFASICPGFVCYAEKTHGDIILPYISRVRSPQAIMGALVKDYLAKTLNIESENIFHAAIMPCYDKKLEAARPDPTITYRAVDCVLTTTEALEILDETEQSSIADKSVSLSSSKRLSWLNTLENGHMMSTEGGSSGGYAEYIVKKFVQNSQQTVTVTKTERNNNLIEFRVQPTSNGNDTPLITVAKCYGFRNLRNVVQQLKRSGSIYDYVEAMACPSGCTNGAGQLSAQATPEQRKELVSEMDRKLLNDDDQWGLMETQMMQVKETWSHLNKDWMRLLYNDEYRPVKQTVMNAIADW